MPKAAVSRSVADLEKALGVRVLERTTRRVALTAAGRLIYPHAKRIVGEVDAACALIARLHAPASGPLRVAAEPTYGRALLAPLVPRFLESFPDVPLEVVLQAVEAQDSWDVAIRAGLPDEARASPIASSVRRPPCCAQRPPICSNTARPRAPRICASMIC